jgi:MYXO-CTERM domain-containing protein
MTHLYETDSIDIRTLLLAFGALVVGGFGCADTTSGPVGADQPDQLASSVKTQAISNGSVDDTHTATVGLVINRSGGSGICSGTLIAQNVVLTARHCVSSTNSRAIQCGETEITSDYDASNIGITTDTRMTQDATFYQGEELYLPEGPELCGRDIALLKLAQPVPMSEAEPLAPRLGSKVSQGETLTARGYGIDVADNGDSGVRREIEGRVVECVGVNCRSDYVRSAEFVTDGGACQGDSGGGVYAGNDQVVGIASRANQDCTFGLYTGVVEWASWIRRNTQRAVSDENVAEPGWLDVGPDDDDDGISNEYDNCPMTPNETQGDLDNDGTGNACDSDIDGDGIPNNADNCPEAPNQEQTDTDGDGQGDACDPDDDGDGVLDSEDNCPQTPNPDQVKTDADNTGDACDDSDGDGVSDLEDNCPRTPNPDQEAICKPPQQDSDHDGIGDRDDNCPQTPNPDQADQDNDGKGDACDDNNNNDNNAQFDTSDDGCSAAGGAGPLGLAPMALGLMVMVAGRRRRN